MSSTEAALTKASLMMKITKSVMKQVKSAFFATSLACSLVSLSSSAADPKDKDKGPPAAEKPSGKKDEDVKKLVEKFQTEREAYLKAESNLKKQLKDANDDKRKALREQLQALRDKWLEEQKDLREDIHQHLKEVQDRLKNHGDLIDDAKDKPRHGGK